MNRPSLPMGFFAGACPGFMQIAPIRVRVRLFAGQSKRGNVPPLWDGRTGERIVEILEHRLCA